MSESAAEEKRDEQIHAQPERVQPVAVPEDHRGPHNHVRWLVLCSALVAGLAAFGIGELVYKIIPAKKILQSVMMTSAKVMAPTPATEREAAARNGALAFGALGLCLAGALGIAGGLARKSRLAALRGGLLGAILGLGLGAGTSLGFLPWFLSLQDRYGDDDLIVLLISLVMHALIWGLLGGVAGLAFAVGTGEPALWRRASIAGIVGGIAGAVAFELLGGLFFPIAATHQPISETWLTRLLARLLVVLAVAIALLPSLAKPRHKAAT
jgi:hypothetical protein